MITLFLLLGAPLGPLRSQPLDDAIRFRHAQAFEQAGDLERAAELYAELWKGNPGNPVFFDSYQRILVTLKRYDEAIVLIRSRLSALPGDIGLRGLLGTVYYRAGRERQAQNEWEAVLKQGPPSQQRYRVIASILTENRLLDRAADVYRRGRAALGDESLFTLELAQLLAASMDYRGATAEYIRWLRRNPAQLAFVQSRLGAFTWKEEGQSAARSAVREARQEQDDLRLQELLAWLYVEGKQFDLALELTREIDRTTDARGNSLYSFAERAFRERAFNIAATAYVEAAAIPIAGTRLAGARYGYALSLSELENTDEPQQGDGVSRPDVPSALRRPSGAVEAFRTVIAEHPGTEYAARALYQIGLLQYRREFDLDGALRSFGDAAREYGGTAVLRYELALRTGEVLVAKGDTGAAKAQFAAVAGAPDALPDQTDEASFRLAELAYFACRFDSAMVLLEAIVVNPRADFANDALALRSFLQEQRGAGDEPVRLMSRADLLARRRSFFEAASTALDIQRRFPASPAADDALLRAAGWLEAAGRFADAAATYDRLILEYRETSSLLDRGLYRLGLLYESSFRDKEKALSAYERLLTEFPNSVLVAETRRNIRRLRGEVL